MRIREPVVAGRFYAAFPDACTKDVTRLLTGAPSDVTASEPLLGGLVPHAGWMCSGAVAARVFKTLAAQCDPDVIVLFGGVHRHRGREAALFGSGRWQTPVGPAEIDDRLAERLLGQTNLIVDDPYAHEQEHSIEVQVPFIVHLFPQAKIVPIMVPPSATAHEVGQAVGRTIEAYNYNALIVGTTDLTHYGPSYDFLPKGGGEAALAWAKQENDRRFIDLVLDMREADVVDEASENRNACSSGATAATLGAVKVLGASSGTLLEHTTSGEVLHGGTGSENADSVGYAGIIFS